MKFFPTFLEFCTCFYMLPGFIGENKLTDFLFYIWEEDFCRNSAACLLSAKGTAHSMCLNRVTIAFMTLPYDPPLFLFFKDDRYIFDCKQQRDFWSYYWYIMFIFTPMLLHVYFMLKRCWSFVQPRSMFNVK